MLSLFAVVVVVVVVFSLCRSNVVFVFVIDPIFVHHVYLSVFYVSVIVGLYCISRLYSADLFPLSKCLSILYRIAPVLQTVLILLSFNRLQVAIAFWRAMGGSEEEIAGLGGDGDS